MLQWVHVNDDNQVKNRAQVHFNIEGGTSRSAIFSKNLSKRCMLTLEQPVTMIKTAHVIN